MMLCLSQYQGVPRQSLHYDVYNNGVDADYLYSMYSLVSGDFPEILAVLARTRWRSCDGDIFRETQ